MLVASLLGIVTNYATNVDDVPLLLRLLQRIAVPGIGLLVVTMVIVQVIVYRLENPAPPQRPDWPRDRVPYPGLDAFAEDEAAVFFGREADTADLTRRLHEVAPRTTDRFIALVGASGSGKSSLVRAGIMPRLRDRRWSVLPAFAPGSEPMRALATAIATAVGDREPVDTILRRLQRAPEALAEELARLRGGGRFQRMLLVIDQFEEVVTLAGERERGHFLEALHRCVERDSRLSVLVTLRIDFLGDLLSTEYAEYFRNPMAIGALGRRQLIEAVEKPGSLVGLSFAPGVVDTIVNDTGSNDALPLLAYLLQELYFGSGPDGTITEELYRSRGGVAGALARQADHTVSALQGANAIDSVLRVLLRFVTVQGQDVARRRVSLTELTDVERRVVDAFIDARLLVSDTEGGDHAGGGAFAQVTHEALFRQWAPLRQEVETQAEHLRQRAELDRWAGDWRRSGCSTDYLLSGERLALAERWLSALEQSGQTSDSARALVEASRRRDLAFLRRVSDSVGRHVLSSAEQDPELAVLLSLAALGECASTPAAQRGLMTALAFSHLRAQLDGHTDTVRHIAWSPSGLWLATASRDGTARIFEASSGRPLRVLRSGDAMVEGVAWSPDSTRLATASRDEVVRIWDVASGEVLASFSGASDIVRQVAWSPDGRWVAATSRDCAVRVWDSVTGDLLHELRGHRGDVWGVAWAPDSTRLATASHDQTAMVWALTTGTSVATLTGHSDFVEGIAWSPDGRSIATGSGDHTVRVWDAHTGNPRLLVRGHADYVWNIAWSPDGRTLASASSDRTVRVVDAQDAKTVAVLRGHTDTVWGVTWSPDGRGLATSSTDGSARIWDVRPRGAESMLLDRHRRPLNRAVWSGDGERIATASDDGTVTVWDASTGAPTGRLVDHDGRVWSVAWSPTGDRLATSSHDGVLRVGSEVSGVAFERRDSVVEAMAWSPDGTRVATGDHDGMLRVLAADSGAELMALSGHQDWVGGVAWSPSGRFIATASDDRTCRLWDAADGRQLTVLRGHENYVDDVDWSPDEVRVVTASGDWTAALWDAATGHRAATLTGHEGRVRAVAWSRDGRRIATGSDDRTVRVWSADTQEPLAVVGVHQDRVTSVQWSPDGTKLLTASTDGTARVWPADPDFARIQATGHGRVFRVLSESERQHHMLPLSP
ncbi:WD40 repeat domain-containing protein [Streptomyces sp. NBC_01803]|uniref:WD40 repeat domain-containing protein n=1 Tax=Streptomyces sp. NBC_01803 TaxID=2975946 RepID=UPI002DDB8C66|nr:WD40 repeat domain-containing protein [Streptomyces sp. NBC_01803]WSA46730.1 WD40 repeat domain-containing protein [Streptomyces sp. NBC_01803]